MTLAMDGVAATPPQTPPPPPPPPSNPLTECDACPYCRDTCDDDAGCASCRKKCTAPPAPCPGPARGWLLDALTLVCQETPQPRHYTMCQLRRHNHAGSAWVLAGDAIYDVTPYLRRHPGGARAILRKAGGAADCAEDLRFHSGRSQRAWKKNRVGTLCRCPRGRKLGLF